MSESMFYVILATFLVTASAGVLINHWDRHRILRTHVTDINSAHRRSQEVKKSALDSGFHNGKLATIADFNFVLTKLLPTIKTCFMQIYGTNAGGNHTQTTNLRLALDEEDRLQMEVVYHRLEISVTCMGARTYRVLCMTPWDDDNSYFEVYILQNDVSETKAAFSHALRRRRQEEKKTAKKLNQANRLATKFS